MSNTTENSVLFSLRELVNLEEERVRSEEKAREQAKLDSIRREEERVAQAREAEAARVRQAEQERLELERAAQEAEERTARERAEQELKIRLDAENAARLATQEKQLEHERELERIRLTTRRGMSLGKVLMIAVTVVSAAGAGVYFGIVKPQREAAAVQAEQAQQARLNAERAASEADAHLRNTQQQLGTLLDSLRAAQAAAANAPKPVDPPVVVAQPTQPPTVSKPPVRGTGRPRPSGSSGRGTSTSTSGGLFGDGSPSSGLFGR